MIENDIMIDFCITKVLMLQLSEAFALFSTMAIDRNDQAFGVYSALLYKIDALGSTFLPYVLTFMRLLAVKL